FRGLKGALAIWSTPELRDYQFSLEQLVSSGPAPGTDDRGHYLSAWLTLVDHVAGLAHQLERYGLRPRVRRTILHAVFTMPSRPHEQVQHVKALVTEIDRLVANARH